MAKKPTKKPKRLGKIVEATEDDKPKKYPNVTVTPEEDTDDCGPDGLTLRQRRFVEAIVGGACGDRTKAAEIAGYRSDNRNALAATASRLLRVVKVSQAIAEGMAKRNLGPEGVRFRLAAMANSSMDNFLSVDDQGRPRPDFEKAASMGAIGQIKEYDEQAGKIKVYDPTRALTTLAQIYGMLKTEQEAQPDSVIRVRRTNRSKTKPDADA